MKKTTLLLLLSLIVFFSSCKKEPQPTLIGKWFSASGGTQFTIENLNGIQIKNRDIFELNGNSLTWIFNPGKDQVITIYIVKDIKLHSMTLEENGKLVYFSKID